MPRSLFQDAGHPTACVRSIFFSPKSHVSSSHIFFPFLLNQLLSSPAPAPCIGPHVVLFFSSSKVCPSQKLAQLRSWLLEHLPLPKKQEMCSSPHCALTALHVTAVAGMPPLRRTARSAWVLRLNRWIPSRHSPASLKNCAKTLLFCSKEPYARARAYTHTHTHTHTHTRTHLYILRFFPAESTTPVCRVWWMDV